MRLPLIRFLTSILLILTVLFTFSACNKKSNSSTVEKSSNKKAKVLEIPFAPDPNLAPTEPPNVSPPTYPPPGE